MHWNTNWPFMWTHIYLYLNDWTWCHGYASVSTLPYKMDLVEEFLQLSKDVTCWHYLKFTGKLLQQLFIVFWPGGWVAYSDQGICANTSWPVPSASEENSSTAFADSWLQYMFMTFWLGKLLEQSLKPEYRKLKTTPWNEYRIYRNFSHALRKNLRELTHLDVQDKNCSRLFWRWLNRQPWRMMLPLPKETHGLT